MVFKKYFGGVLFFSVLVLGVLFSLDFVSAQSNCYQYSSVANGCTSANGCIFKNDSWSESGWCEDLNCWSLWSQSDCSSIEISGKNCTWQAGGTDYYCGELSCYTYSGTNESACTNNTAGRSCGWYSECHSSGGGGNANCWSIGTESTCTNTTGCSWGDCRDKGCSEYSVGTCNAALDPWGGQNCTWTGSNCKESRCSDTVLYANSTSCNAASHCSWSGSASTGWCGEVNCGSFQGNQTGCTNSNNTNGIDCVWESGICREDSCWNYDADQASCSSKAECAWSSWTSSGWCEEINCWTWDSMHGGDEVSCNQNATLYGLSCNWVSQSGVNGWCEKNYSSTDCTSYANERQCYDSYYCWWQANNWNDVTAGGNCTAPDWTTISDSTGGILNSWNPGCYIFDNNATECGFVDGCDNSTAGSCNINATHSYADYIGTNGMNCTIINNSGLCNSIPALSTCCSWQSGSCTDNSFSSTCWSDLKQTPSGEKSCEDSTTKSNCNSLAGSPWYWPCKWDNVTIPAKCTIKSDDIWGNGTKSFVTIENKKTCESVGGKWITENYCAGNVSVPTGRCEYKFDDEKNCDKACFACEYKSDGSAHNSTAVAKAACYNSKLGFCEFSADSSAPNGYGKCRAKAQFTSGVAEGCSASNCAGCTFAGVGNKSLAVNGTKSAKNYCEGFLGSCKWMDDASASTGGYCVDAGTKNCKDKCDRCETKSTCVNDGRSDVTNVSGSCKWQGDDNEGDCVENVAGDVEICWNGADDDADGLVDCADPGCYSDSFCGFVEGNCFVWTNSSNCASDTDCEWIVDKWGSWCDFKGSQCWRYDGSQSKCDGATNVTEVLNLTLARLPGNNINETYTFALANLGIGWVGGTVLVTNSSGTSLAGNYTVDYSAQTINFTNNTFMVYGGGLENLTNVSYQYNSSTGQYCEWQAGSGSGWCEQDWSIAEECFLGKNESHCDGMTTSDGQTCSWKNDTWCNSQGNGTDWCAGNAGWCDHPDFAPQDCWQNSDNSSCSGASGCNWRVDEWSQPHCEMNWSGSCWNYFDNDSCGAVSGCSWNVDQWGSYCDTALNSCWKYSSQNTCVGASVACTWQNYSGGGGNCQPACYNSTASGSSSACVAISGCMWKEENGWCEDQQSQKCFNETNKNDEGSCSATSGCSWRGSGWCNPKDGFSTGTSSGGGGVGGSMGDECYKYDGNKTQCTNKSITGSNCGWFAETNPWCEVDWSTDCWQYSVESDCISNGCWFKNDTYGSYCTNLMDQCWSNTTLQGDATACNSNQYCNATTWGTCEPTCFSASTEGTCGTGCKWLTGWCNGAGMVDMFNEMESGAPVPLGIDTCDGVTDTTQQSVDICGFGMKDMGDSYGFGSNMFNFENSSVCNKVKISSFVVDMAGGGGGGVGGPGAGVSDKTGDGNDTIKYIVYLDADGLTTGGCAIESLSGSEGYEFKLRYASEWNANTSKAVETFTSYKCKSSKWVATDIKTSAWKQKMCNEIGGPMIAVEKGELARFPTLYTSTADLRVYVVSIGNTGNVSTPSDSAGPGWATPGSIDFEVGGAMNFGANAAKFENILQNGYVKYEDCYNGVDDDEDGSIDCNDWNCEFSTNCTSKGVNDAEFSDTTMPKVKGVRVEEYPDSALVMFETTKPVNGTLKFYATDADCKTLNASINDLGIRSSKVRTYKMWQEMAIYNDGGVASLDYALQNDTSYYYKLKVCDTDNRCALSKCTKFKTSNTNKCGFCNFVLKLKVPSGWTASYDVGQDGTYEHVDGGVCGSNAGMKMNYTLGRSIAVKLAADDGSTYFEFLNVSVSKTGLNDKVRELSGSGDSLINDGTVVGLNAQSRDKIINNLHPEVCRIKVPFSGTCDTLYHCDDSGNNCVDRTASAGGVPIDSTNCIWEVPFCEFSGYREALSGTTTTTTPGSGSGSGSGAGVTTTTNTTENEDSSDSGSDDASAGDGSGGEAGGDGKGGTDSEILNDVAGRGIFWIVIGILLVAGIVGAFIGFKSVRKKKRGY